MSRVFFYTFLVIKFTFNISFVYSQNADINLLRSINLHRNTNLKGAMTGLTNTAYYISAGVPIAELVAGYAKADQYMIQSGWQTVAGLGVNTLLTFGLKYGIDRKRPYITYPSIQNYQNDSDPSFPSGHTSFSFCTATSLSICFPKWYVIAPAYLWASAVGYSRLYLGMHYPTDVLGGAVTGAAASFLSYYGNKWLIRRKTRKEFMN